MIASAAEPGAAGRRRQVRSVTTDEDLIRTALAVAATAGPRDVPIGAVVIGADGTELARAVNAREALGDPTAHAEILALREAAAKIGNYRLAGAEVYSTLEPCVMCAGALVAARVARLVFGARDLRFGGVRSKFRIADSEALNHRVEIVEGVLATECVELLRGFFEKRR